ncbi:arginine-tRNA-protein transferase [Lenzites betulinus]|nr:arginine-tRNA-protein transferase [Lenzites betulinus]
MATSDEPISVVSLLRASSSTCGYCGPPGERSKTASSYHKAECLAMQLSCRVYQEMIDRGWRRSGTYCYKPDLRRSCCPQYTIKLDALEFKPSKSQRKLLNRWNRFVIHRDGREDDNMKDESKTRPSKAGPSKGKGKSTHIFTLTEDIHASELGFFKDETPAHTFEVTLEPASYTEEKFALYRSYQKEIHHEAAEKGPSSFKRFLVENPLVRQAIAYPSERPAHLPVHYGAYHQLYRIDGKLIAMGVIDILPNCVSSVYFMYEKEWDRFSLGKLSALREAALAREMHEAGVEHMKYLYMGFYVHSCPKMRYKGDFAPSYLADPEDYEWYPLETCRPLLDKYHYAGFAHPERSLEAPAETSGMKPGGRGCGTWLTSLHVPTDPVAEVPPEVLENVQHIAEFRRNQIVVAPITVSLAATPWPYPAGSVRCSYACRRLQRSGIVSGVGRVS